MNSPVPSAAATRCHGAKYLTFRMQRESYAFPVMQVSEIIRIRGEITPVPQMPAYVRGVINLRGKVIPVIDLRARFQLTDITDNDQTCTIVVQACGSQFGLVVDGVEEVSAITPEDMTPPPNFGADSTPDYLLGMARTRSGLKCLLDLDRIISGETLARITGVAPESGANNPIHLNPSVL